MVASSVTAGTTTSSLPVRGRGHVVHETTPQVFLVARPSLDLNGISSYLDLVGGQAHYLRLLNGVAGENGHQRRPGSFLIELMGRLCYRSWDIGLNPNVTQIRTDRRKYLENIIKTGHGSVLEHASYSFIFAYVSRVFTHELVRHRAGTAFSQESMRFVRLEDLGFAMPDIFPETPEGAGLEIKARMLLEYMEEFQLEAARVNGLDDEGVPFARKKEITSAMRRFAPDGLSTHIGFTANVRTLRWLTQLRTDPSAEVEIRKVFGLVGDIMAMEEPILFEDFEVSDDGAWVTEHRKV